VGQRLPRGARPCPDAIVHRHCPDSESLATRPTDVTSLHTVEAIPPAEAGPSAAATAVGEGEADGSVTATANPLAFQAAYMYSSLLCTENFLHVH
jgi:hypothetical protein